MNVVEAYIKFKGQLIIMISGINGCGKTTLAKNISNDMKLTRLDQFDYYKKDYDKKVTLSDGTTLINLHTDEAIDWDRFNNDVNKYKKNGVVVTVFSAPIDKLNFDTDYHIHLSISKKKCLERRRIFLTEHKEKYYDEYKLIGTPTEKLKMNKLIFPYYLKSIKKMKINKFIKVSNKTDDQIYDIVFDLIIKFIEKYLYVDRFKNYNNQMKTLNS